VIATRNRPELLRSALAAVTNQAYGGDIHCYVVFDQSAADETLASGDRRRSVTVMSNHRTAGLAGARNAGILAGTSPLVAFCDDDDEWLPTKVSAQVEALHPSDIGAVCGITIEYEDRQVTRVPREADLTVESLARHRVMEAHPSTVLVRREALIDDIGLVDEEIPGSYGEDYDWILRAVAAGRLAVVPAPLVTVRWGQSQFSDRWRTIHDALEYMIVKHECFRADPRALGRLRGQQAFALAALGERRHALTRAGQTLRSNPREPRGYLAVAVALGTVSARRVLTEANKRGRGI
jgi:glycosyltransferase involved in cell wall biosynthesis